MPNLLGNYKRREKCNGLSSLILSSSAAIRQTVDLRWLEAFDSLYCGDPRLSDVPAMNFWRTMDIYSDHMVRYYETNIRNGH